MQNAELRMEKENEKSEDLTARNLANQLLDAGTSVGANLEEAEAGQSKPDFVSKCRISLKEARESLYWLRIFGASEIVKPKQIAPLIQEANEIVAILTSIVRNSTKRAA